MCTPFSPMGAGDKLESTDEMVSMCAWMGLELSLDTPVIVFENSGRCDEKVVLEPVFGERWIIQNIRICGSKFGFWTKRPRLYVVMSHRVWVMTIFASLANTIRLFFRPCALSWHAALQVVPEKDTMAQLKNDVQWAIGRKSSKSHGKSLGDVWLETDACFRALSDTEEEWLLAGQRTVGMNECHNLSQNPLADRGVQTQGHFFYTIVKNPAIHFATAEGRWLVGTDLLLLQGFPILPWLANPKGKPRVVCSFCEKAGVCFNERSRSRVNQQVGNSMVVPCISAVLLYVIACLKIRSEDDSVAQFLRQCGVHFA